jgi:hypothetical membrane protein
MTYNSDTLGRQAALVSILAAIYFLLAAIAAHLTISRYDLVRDYISDYAVGPWGWIYGSAFWASSIGCLALVISLAVLVPSHVQSKLGLVLLAVVGATYAVDFFFPTEILLPGAPPTTAVGRVHLLAALLGWLLFTISAFLLSSRLKRDAYWRPWRDFLSSLAWIAALLLVTLVAVVASKVPWGGLAEKGFILDRNVWALVVGVLAFRSPRTPRQVRKR